MRDGLVHETHLFSFLWTGEEGEEEGISSGPNPFHVFLLSLHRADLPWGGGVSDVYTAGFMSCKVSGASAAITPTVMEY